jgi:peptidyl-prolyl cis-trans isomerase SurA
MKKVILMSILFLISTNVLLFGEGKTGDPVLLKINDREITLSEFEYVYTKNNLNSQIMDPKSINEYLELFVNFNLKVYEALQMGLDTVPAFINELEGYRKQLAQPYLTDQDVSNHLLEEAYQRFQWDVRASHILLRLDKHALPADTVAAWRKAIDIRNKILAGASFEAMAREFSEDPSAQGLPGTANRAPIPGNSGDLNYFSVLDMVYPFETAAFSLKVNEISMPVRTDFGYHLVKVTDRLPAMGRARVAHIMINTVPDFTQEQLQQAEEKIKEIHQKILAGEEFEALAQRFSDDKASGRRGGELPVFTANRMVPEFIKAISLLNDQNVYSNPVKTQYGWHIIKLYEKTLPPTEEVMADLKNRISRDSRAFLSQQVVIERLKNEYGFTQNDANLEYFIPLVDESVFEGSWQKPANLKNESVLFSFGGQKFTVGDFAKYLSENQGGMRNPESVRGFVGSLYKNFQQEQILEYEERQLAVKYPDFRKIMREYHDGILLFELTDQKVWGKAMADTTGLLNFYSQNLDKYMWDNRFNAVVYTFSSDQTARKGRSFIRKSHKKGVSLDDIIKTLNKDSQLNVSVDKGFFEIGPDTLFEILPRKKGASKVIQYKGNPVVVWVNEYLPAQPKKINEIRGLVIADYQNFLEDQWIKELRVKYPFTLNHDALNYLNNR